MTAADADVVVVGGGPAGSSAAFFLATRGHRVLLLDKRRFPRDKSCGDGITRPGVELLAEIGVLPALASAQRFDGFLVHVRGRTRDLDTLAGRNAERRPDRGMVVPRLRLDDVLFRAAAEAGAEACQEWEATDLLWEGGRVAGVRAVHGGVERSLRAAFVVCADGATAGLGRTAGLVPTPRDAMGYAIRGYYTGLDELPGKLEFYIPITDPADENLLPSYGWVFPTGAGEANVGVGLSFRADGANVRRLLERFVLRLREQEPRFRDAELSGALRGAPLRSDLTPERCAAPGLLVAGDAAGMVSPFTGEGISYALESGKLAADVIHESRHRDPAESYVSTLRRRYGGYFETGRETSRRYQLVFRVLESTFDDDRPVFNLWRRAALMPEGVGGLRSSDVVEEAADLVEPLVARLRADLAAVDEVLVRTVQRDWPFLSRLGSTVERDVAVPARPATLLLLVGYLGSADGRTLVEMAAAVELSFFAALSHAGIDPDPGPGDAVHWGNIFAILAGNFQLARALELSARAGGAALQRTVGAVTALSEARVRELRVASDPTVTPRQYVDAAAGVSGLTFRSIAGLGAELSGLDEEDAANLRDYGHHLGVAYQLAEEIVSTSGGYNTIGASATAELARGRLVLPVVVALGDQGIAPAVHAALAAPGDRQLADAAIARVSRSRAMGDSLRLVRQHGAAAAEAARRLKGGDAREALRELAAYPARRAAPHVPRPPRAADTRPPEPGGGDGVAWSVPELLGVTEDVARLDELLAQWRGRVDEDVRPAVNYQLSGRSKYYRPCTVFACHRAATGRAPTPAVLRAAAAIELFHNYTLIVDDIVDRDIYRRGRLALHRRFGRTRGLATGAYLAFGAAEIVAQDTETCLAFDELGKRIVVGECRQWRLRRTVGDVDVWRTIAGEDTGVMFETCARVAVPDRSLDRFGYLLGTLYHGCDDVADVRGAAALGGGSEKDVADRILTLPAAIAVQDPDTARLFEEGGADADDEIALRFGMVLDDAEAVLDGIAGETEREAILRARRPEPLLALIRYTRELSRA